MSRIKILPENLANQIAAGEVVERPASVVKELVENALDAGATRIAVQVEGAGTRMLRVIDNGCGMDPDDALLCLERHATSKLKSAADLIHLKTLGFRGEAIPSIASVSRLTITSRPAAVDLGCRVEVRFGAVNKVHEMGCAQGTVVEVADLFANVPARRKFLKSATTELAHIDEAIRSYALVNFRTAFSYQVNGRDLLDLPASGDTAERRVRQVLSDSVTLIPIAGDAAAARPEIVVSGFLLPPDQTSGRAGRLWTFVNGRYIKDRMVNHAVAEGMAGFLMRGGRPAGVVHLHLPPEGVDVNVHPTKQEVRFSESNLIHNKIVAAIWRSLEAYQGRLKEQIFGLARQEATFPGQRREVTPDPSPLEVREPGPLPVVAPSTPLPAREEKNRVLSNERQPSPAEELSPCQPPLFPVRDRLERPATTQPLRLANSGPLPPTPPVPGSDQAHARQVLVAALVERGESAVATGKESASNAGDSTRVKPSPAAEQVPDQGPPLAPAPATACDSGSAVTGLRYLGQLFDTYLLCQVEDGLVAIDQHAVQERLIFEELKRAYGSGTMPGQILLFPVMVELLPAEVEALGEHGAELQRLGLDLQEFGGDTVVIKAVPAGLAHLHPTEVLRGILGRFLDDQPPGQGRSRLDEVLAAMACKAAIKAGHPLTPVEVQHLLARIERSGVFSHCPHGRPVSKRFSRGEIERWFQRG